MRQPTHEANDPTRAGQNASKPLYFGEDEDFIHGGIVEDLQHKGAISATGDHCRYYVVAYHTSGNAIVWMVFDYKESFDTYGYACEIRQETSFEKAIEGLATFTPEPVPVTVADSDTEKRIAALIDHLDGTALEDIYPGFQPNSFRIGKSDFASEYLILTDEEATEKTHEDIEESLWAFRASFLLDFMPEGLTEHDLKKISAASCEDASPIFRALIEAGKGLDRFKVAAIEADGRGHFLSSYDGAENKNDDASLFIYRTN